MFYERFIQMCESRGVKPTPVLKSLGISPGNMARWQTGASINSATLQKIADHFEVSIDYFLSDDLTDDDLQRMAENVKISGVESAMVTAKNYPDFVNSIMSGKVISPDTLKRVANYLRCPLKYFVREDNSVLDSGREDNPRLSDKELIIDILSRIPASKGYKYLQVAISRTIADNLSRNGITLDMLLETRIAAEKARNLYDKSTDNTKILAFTNSDLIRIIQNFPMTYDTLFTGME